MTYLKHENEQGLYVLKIQGNKRTTIKKTLKQVKALALLQCQSQDAKARIHQGLTQRQSALQLPFVLQHKNRLPYYYKNKVIKEQ